MFFFLLTFNEETRRNKNMLAHGVSLNNAIQALHNMANGNHKTAMASSSSSSLSNVGFSSGSMDSTSSPSLPSILAAAAAAAAAASAANTPSSSSSSSSSSSYTSSSSPISSSTPSLSARSNQFNSALFNDDSTINGNNNNNNNSGMNSAFIRYVSSYLLDYIWIRWNEKKTRNSYQNSSNHENAALQMAKFVVVLLLLFLFLVGKKSRE